MTDAKQHADEWITDMIDRKLDDDEWIAGIIRHAANESRDLWLDAAIQIARIHGVTPLSKEIAERIAEDIGKLKGTR